MRLIGMILALGVILWVMLEASGGGNSDSVIAAGHQDAMEKAQSVESALQGAAQRNLQGILGEEAPGEDSE
ncbi:MAG: hypothetical protein AB8C02_08660 [Halioglobus sp.]